MRVWSVHPRYLDPQGLVALWRETLLAQKVLRGLTKGYTRHPQLIRFQEHPKPLEAIGHYLCGVCDEALSRGYNFDRSKVIEQPLRITPISVTKGQLAYEFEWLCAKLKVRSALKYKEVAGIGQPGLHPSFRLVAGGVAAWEKVG